MEERLTAITGGSGSKFEKSYVHVENIFLISMIMYSLTVSHIIIPSVKYGTWRGTHSRPAHHLCPTRPSQPHIDIRLAGYVWFAGIKFGRHWRKQR